MKKKIIIFSKNNPYQIFLINKIIEEGFILEGVFFQGKGSLKKRYKRIKKKSGSSFLMPFYFLKKRYNFIRINKIIYPYSKKYKEDVYNKLFGNRWRKINLNKERIFYHKKFRFSQYLSKIKEINPDVIIVHGGGIVPNKIITCANDYAINLHWGLSPYYRGSYCTAWCVLNNEVNKIAVTIHSLTDIIDGGPIYMIKRPQIKKNDNIFTIEMKLTKVGTEIIIELLRRIENGEKLVEEEQDLSKGKFYWVKEFNPSNARKVMKKIKNGIFRGNIIERTI